MLKKIWMPSRSELLSLAEEADREASRIETETAEAVAALRRQAALFRHLAEESPVTKRLLQKREQLSIVNSNKMTPDHRLAISKGRAEKDPFTVAARKAGYSQNTLAKAVGVKPSMLSMYRKGHRKIPLKRAERVQELTGWPADGKHWRGGITTGN